MSKVDPFLFKDKQLNKISIITIVYNGENEIKDTIESVIRQTYSNIEYIIIDGKSNDSTLKIVESYSNEIDLIISEPDLGIYDAMNKGIQLATGNWINFMNAGDVFYSKETLQNIFNQDYHDSKILYGKAIVSHGDKTKVFKNGKIKNLDIGTQFCHQSTFIDLALHKEYPFNISNKISGDFEFFYTVRKKKFKFEFIDLFVSKISSGGTSDVNRIDGIVACWNVVEKSPLINLRYIGRILLELTKSLIKNTIKR